MLLFLSYAEHDSRVSETKLTEIHRSLEELVEDEDIVFNYRNLEEVSLGENIAMITNSDLAVVLLTKKYAKEISDSRSRSKAFLEYMHIESTYKKSRNPRSIDKSKAKAHFTVVYISLDHTISKHYKLISESILDLNDPQFKEIINTIKIQADEQYSKKYDDLKRKLFLDTKHTESTSSSSSVQDFYKTCFVKTETYRDFKSGNRSILIGRKGSGKSTLANAIYETGTNVYSSVVKLSAEDIDLNIAKSYLSEKFDISNSLIVHKIFTLAWFYLIQVCLLDSLYKSKRNPENDDMKIHKYLSDILHEDVKSRPEHLRYSTYYKHVMSEVGQFASAFQDDEHNLNIWDFSKTIIPDEILSVLYASSVMRNQRILITLDNFDTVFGKFRHGNNNDGVDYARFESGWLGSLLQLVIDIKDMPDKYNLFSQKIDFCITVPGDRFIEFKLQNRDAYRFESKTSPIRWSGIELAEVMIKRFKQLQDVFPTSRTSIKARNPVTVQENLKNSIDGLLPDIIEFKYNGKLIAIPLFCYILRHTFWRPRDVITMYARLLMAANESRERRIEFSTTAIRSIVSRTTFEIVNNEFLKEFSDSFNNLHSFLENFESCKQILSFEDIMRMISGKSLILATNHSPVNVQRNDAIETLFEIGFLGLHDPQYHKPYSKGLIEDMFCFHEGKAIFTQAKNKSFAGTKFIINPVFNEQYNIDCSDNDFQVLYNWEYLECNHLIKTANKHEF